MICFSSIDVDGGRLPFKVCAIILMGGGHKHDGGVAFSKACSDWRTTCKALQ